LSENAVVMGDPPGPPAVGRQAGGRLPVLLCVLFFISGSSGLIYEVVWLRMLSRTLGSTVYATSTILAVFMGGLALGSFLLGRYADRVRRLLVLYGLLEAGIGIGALLSLGMNRWPVPLYRALYAFAGEHRAALTLCQMLLAAAAMLLPTILMGATLPTLCAYGARRTREMGRIAGTLYALNTLGAMAGVAISGFLLIGTIGETRTVLIGVGINFLVAVLAFLLLLDKRPDGGGLPAGPPEPAAFAATPESQRITHAVLLCFAISGFVSLAMEIIWSRMLALYTGTSIYAFSAMLTVMLGGIGAGGWAGRRVERSRDPLLLLARLQFGLALTSLAGMIAYPYLGRGLVVAPLVMVGPASILLGIGFPVTVKCYTRHAAAIGRRVGELYAWNTVGCIAGSLAGGFLLLPLLGTAGCAVLLPGLWAFCGLLLLAAHPRTIRGIAAPDLAMFLAVPVAAYFVGNPYTQLITGRILRDHPRSIIYAQVEEASATTVASGEPDTPTRRSLLVNGEGMTALFTGNKLMAHLPLWMAHDPHNAVVICMGMGTSFRSAARHPDIDVTVVELVPTVPRLMPYFHTDALQVMAQPNAHIVVDDGRNYLLMHSRPLDVITIDPAPPIESAGTVNLYTTEFFKLCRSRISDGGVVCLWLPPAPASESRMVLHTFASVFPNVSVYSGPAPAGFYLLGTEHPLENPRRRIEQGFADRAIVKDLLEWDETCATPEKVNSLWLCDRDELLRFCGDAPIISDDHPYTEFPLQRSHTAAYLQSLDASDVQKWLMEERHGAGFNTAWEAHPDVDAHADMAVWMRRHGHYAEAELHYREVLRQAPRRADAHAGLGVMSLNIGQFDAAGDEFQQALAQDPDQFEALIGLGQVDLRAGKFEQTAELAQRALALQGDSIDAHSNLAAALIQLHRNSEAILPLEAILRLRPEDRAAAAALENLRKPPASQPLMSQ
jgi:spermidine synthase